MNKDYYYYCYYLASVCSSLKYGILCRLIPSFKHALLVQLAATQEKGISFSITNLPIYPPRVDSTSIVE